MFQSMLRFELRYQLTRPVTWLYLIVFIAQGLIFMGSAGVVLAGGGMGQVATTKGGYLGIPLGIGLGTLLPWVDRAEL